MEHAGNCPLPPNSRLNSFYGLLKISGGNGFEEKLGEPNLPDNHCYTVLPGIVNSVRKKYAKNAK